MNENDLTIITTHINADYDALASLLAAKKMYPGSLVALPGSPEKNSEKFLRGFHWHTLLNIYGNKEDQFRQNQSALYWWIQGSLPESVRSPNY